MALDNVTLIEPSENDNYSLPIVNRNTALIQSAINALVSAVNSGTLTMAGLQNAIDALNTLTSQHTSTINTLVNTTIPRFDTALSDKVDKVNGKGLSSNDYTDNDKEALQVVVQKVDSYYYYNSTPKQIGVDDFGIPIWRIQESRLLTSDELSTGYVVLTTSDLHVKDMDKVECIRNAHVRQGENFRNSVIDTTLLVPDSESSFSGVVNTDTLPYLIYTLEFTTPQSNINL